jgi:hypothetical protein
MSFASWSSNLAQSSLSSPVHQLNVSDFFAAHSRYFFEEQAEKGGNEQVLFFSTYKLVVRLCRCRNEREKKRANEKFFPIFPLSTSPSLASSCVISILVFYSLAGGSASHTHELKFAEGLHNAALFLLCAVGKKRKKGTSSEREKSFESRSEKTIW